MVSTYKETYKEGSPVIEEGQVSRISHIQINCSDFKRSVAFYELLGFRVDRIISDDHKNPPDINDLSTVPLRKGAAGETYTVGMGLGDDPRAMTKIELIQWKFPQKQAVTQHPKDLLGMVRVAFTVRGLDQLVARMKEHNHKIEDTEFFDISAKLSSKFVHLFDPDGCWITLMEWIKK